MKKSVVVTDAAGQVLRTANVSKMTDPQIDQLIRQYGMTWPGANIKFVEETK